MGVAKISAETECSLPAADSVAVMDLSPWSVTPISIGALLTTSESGVDDGRLLFEGGAR